MSDKPRHDAGDFFAIPGTTLLSLEGPDALAFAQAQFCNDVSALAPGQWQWNGWLTPKGRVIALFALLRTGEQSLLLLLLDADAREFATRLQRFVFRSKVAISVRSDLHAAGRLAAPVQAEGPRFADSGGNDLELDVGTAAHPRTLRIGAPATEDREQSEAWRRLDIAHGLPRLASSQAEQWTPQQLSLDRLRAYSVKKGCYPGQEIVARTHFLGQAKRGLARLRVEAAAPAEVMSADGSRALGQLLCTAGDEGLAVMPLDAGDGPFLADGRPAVPQPLLDGLGR
jgi:folate-binding protein YgfZ